MNRTVAIHFVRAALRGARRRQQDPQRLLQSAGITPALLEQPRARVTFEQYARLIQSLWQGLDDELMGFGPAASRHGSFAMMCQAIIHCATLEHALRRGFRFYALFPHAPCFSLLREDRQARIEVRLEGYDDPDHFLVESLLVIWHRLSCWLIGRRIPLDGASFDYPAPPHRDEYPLLFNCPLGFAAPVTSLSFPAEVLEQPLLQDEQSLRTFLARAPYDLLSRPDYTGGLASRVRRLLSRVSDGQRLDAAGAASRLAMSPQTLRRRLAQEGQSFQGIKDQWRRDLAIGLLVDNQASLGEIARQLGFSEASAFHRAFRRWTGVTPRAYRKL